MITNALDIQSLLMNELLTRVQNGNGLPTIAIQKADEAAPVPAILKDLKPKEVLVLADTGRQTGKVVGSVIVFDGEKANVFQTDADTGVADSYEYEFSTEHMTHNGIAVLANPKQRMLGMVRDFQAQHPKAKVLKGRRAV